MPLTWHNPKDMKIAFDAKRYYHNQTGLGNYSRTLVSGLQKLDTSLDTLLYDARSFNRSFGLGRQAKKDGADIYHGLSNEIPFDIHKGKIPSIVTIHDVCWRTYPDMYHFFDRKIYDLKYGWSARNADGVLAISESTKQDIMAFYDVPEERIQVIYQPVNEIYYQPITREEALSRMNKAGITLPQDFMLYVGSVNSRKNLMGVVQAMAQLPESCRLPLVVIGGGREYKDLVLKEIHRLSLDNLIIWVSCSETVLLQSFYTLASLFVYPSFYEGFGLPVVEAALSGCPVLTSNVSSLPEAGGPNTLQATPTSIEDIAQKMERGICDNELRKKMIEGARNYALTQFAPCKLFQQVLDFYGKIKNQ